MEQPIEPEPDYDVPKVDQQKLIGDEIASLYKRAAGGDPGARQGLILKLSKVVDYETSKHGDSDLEDKRQDCFVSIIEFIDRWLAKDIDSDDRANFMDWVSTRAYVRARYSVDRGNG